MTNNNYTNYFKNKSFDYTEIVELAQDITLPKVTNEPVDYDFFESGGIYTAPHMVYKDIKAKFYIQIMTPLVDRNGIDNKLNSSPSTRNHKGNTLNTSSYSTSNYIKLTIPKYILLNFTNKIPKGTKFIVASIGGQLKIEKMRIIGIFERKEENNGK